MSTIFDKIIKRELPADIVFENERVIVIKDIYPKAPVHLLIIPKKKIINLQSVLPEDMSLIVEIVQIAQKLAVEFHIAEGYRFTTNNGADGGQIVMHLHFHLMGGKKLEDKGMN